MVTDAELIKELLLENEHQEMMILLRIIKRLQEAEEILEFCASKKSGSHILPWDALDDRQSMIHRAREYFKKSPDPDRGKSCCKHGVNSEDRCEICG